MRGVVLAGGTAARMRPVSEIINKHLLPVYDRPMITYPIQTLLRAGIREILLVTGPDHMGSFTRLLGSGSRFGCGIAYAAQESALGTGSAVQLSERFTRGGRFATILGDNIFTEDLTRHVTSFNSPGAFPAKILVSRVKDPRGYGVVAFQGKTVTGIVEKPATPPSRCVSTGFWLLSNGVFERLRTVRRSPRNEYEMTDVLSDYAREGLLDHGRLKSPWFDVGTFESLHVAAGLMRRMGAREKWSALPGNASAPGAGLAAVECQLDA